MKYQEIRERVYSLQDYYDKIKDKEFPKKTIDEFFQSKIKRTYFLKSQQK
jgi:hypothetical protein